MFGHDIEKYINRFRAFDFEVIAINGHDFNEIDAAFHRTVKNNTQKPCAIIAKTFKGKGISFLENKDGWHGKALKKDELQKALAELGNTNDNLRFNFKKPASATDGKNFLSLYINYSGALCVNFQPPFIVR